MDMAPLAGIRVVDLTRFISGPYLTMFLGDLGADVIKVEHPVDGDATRRWGSGPYPADNPYYLSVNRNKRSIGLDLKHQDGLQTLEALIAKSDVLVVNAISGALENIGLTPQRLSEINPRCVVCEITGYGDRGPARKRGAFDFTIQAESGMMALNGEPDGAPMKVGAPIMDVLTGLTGCVGVLSALFKRQMSGRAQRVSTSMMETALACMPNIVSDYLVGGIAPARYGNAHPNLVPYEIYETSDRWLALGLGNEPQWKRFCGLIERPDLRDDERFDINTRRIANRDALNLYLRPIFAKRPLAWWLEQLERNAIPCAPVNTVAHALDSEQVQEIELIRNVSHPLYESIRMVRSPISVDGEPLPIRLAPPCLGQHTDEILTEVLGLATESIEALRAAGAVAGSAVGTCRPTP